MPECPRSEPTTPRLVVRAAAIAVGGATLAATVAGCRFEDSVAPGPIVSIGDFVVADAGPRVPSAPGSEPGPSEDVPEAVDPGPPIPGLGASGPGFEPGSEGPAPDSDPAIEALVRPESPARPAPRRLQAGDRIVLDSLVGQINGRPIFADEFFEAIADRLRAEAATARSRTDFAAMARDIIGRRLQVQVTESLFLAEAENALSSEQQQGLRFWIDELRKRKVASQGRSRAEADRRLRETQGRTLEEVVEAEKNEALQQNLFRERFGPKIVVSKFEIEREYQRRFEEFNPPPATRIDRLVVFKSRPEAIAEVTRRLDAGEPIAAIADDLVDRSLGRRQSAGEFGVAPANLAEWSEATDLLRRVAADFEAVGDWSGPDERSSSVSWWFVGAVSDSTGRALSDDDVQRQIKAELRGRKLAAEEQRYIAELRQDSIVDEERRMLGELLEIAVRRYWPG